MKTKLFLYCMVMISMLNLHAAEPLKVWKGIELGAIRFSSRNAAAAIFKGVSDTKTPNGNAAMEIHLKDGSQTKNAWDIQLNYLYNGSLQSGHNYEITFMCMAEKPGQIHMIPAQTQKPYASVDSFAFTKVDVDTKWSNAKIMFTPKKDWSPENLAIPRMMFANYGNLGKIYIGQITLREKPTVVPYILSNDWKVFQNVKAPENFSNIPEYLPSDNNFTSGKSTMVNSRQVIMGKTGIDLSANNGHVSAKQCAVLYSAFNSPVGGVMYVGISADWWMELYVNGKCIYSSMKDGNGTSSYTPDDHIVEVPVKAGKNILAVKVLSGSAGWRFVCGKPTKDINDLSLMTIKSGKDWKPIDETRFIVKSGTALDFSNFLDLHKPAGVMGKVVVNSSGKFAFEKSSGKKALFRGFNAGFLWKIDRFTKEQLNDFAINVARQGYNAVRFQGLDMGLCGGSSPNISNSNFDDALQNDDVVFDEQTQDKIDYLLSRLKANGIYYNIDLMNNHGYVHRQLWVKPKSRWQGGFKVQLLYNSAHRRHWEKAIRKILNHTNPYTGIAFKDDPALFCIEPLNEQDIRFSEPGLGDLTPGFKKYLKTKYKNEGALRKVWGLDATFESIPDVSEKLLRRGDVRSKDAGDFLIATMSETTKWYTGILRDCGYTGLLTQWDMIMRTMEMPARALLPVIAQHTYFEHPQMSPTKNLVVKSPHNRLCYGNEHGDLKYDTLCAQRSSLNSSYCRAAAIVRYLDRPFMITEYSHGFFSRFRHERGLFFGAYAALQGWSGLFVHGQMVNPESEVEYPLVYFENQRDPISRASEIIVASAWHRGDVKEANHIVEMKLSDKALFPKHYLSAFGDDYGKLSMLTKIGLTYPEITPISPVGKIKPDITLIPEEFSNLDVRMWFATASNANGTLLPSLIGKLKSASILQKDNATDIAKGIYQSDTREITLDSKNETMTVITPYMEGALLKTGVSVSLKNMTISSCSKPASVALIALEKSVELSSAKHLLMVFSTNALNEGMIFSDADMTRMVEIGKKRLLLETAKLSVDINTDKSSVKVYPLYLDGTRMKEIPAVIDNGKVKLSINTADIESGAVFFELLLQ